MGKGALHPRPAQQAEKAQEVRGAPGRLGLGYGQPGGAVRVAACQGGRG